MTQVFISYSRKDAEAAKRLTASLESCKIDAWIDWIDIPPCADWWDQIQKGIEEADCFIFLLSPDSARSEVCGREITHAVQNGKRLIPVTVRDVNPIDAPPVLAKLNWIFCREEKDVFDAAFEKLSQAIHTDLEWTQLHRRLQVRALEWEKKNKEDSFLVRGKDLQDAEQQLSVNSSKDPIPTDLQREYVLNSRQLSDRQRHRNTMLAIAAVIVFAILALFGFNRAVEATKQADIAQTARAVAVTAQVVAVTNEAKAKEQAQISFGREIAAYSVAARDPNFNLSLLLGIEAFGIDDNIQTRSELLNNILKNPDLHQFLIGHTDDVSGVAFSPDGKIAASGSDDNTVILWDVETGHMVGSPLTKHHGWVNSVAFSPNGKVLASGSCGENVQNWNDCYTGEIILWDVDSGKPIGEPIVDNSGAVLSLAFSPDGKILASGSYFGIMLRDAETHQPLGERLMGHPDLVTSVVFSPDGGTLASGSFDNRIILWDVAKHEARAELPGHTGVTGYNPYVTSLAFDPNGQFLASGGADRTVMLWDMQSLEPIGAPLLGHTGNVNSVAISAGGSTLASASSDKTIILWDVSDSGATQRKTLLGHGDAVTSVAFSPMDGTLISGGRDATVILWKASETSPVPNHVLPGSTSAVFSPDGKIIASADCETFADKNNCTQGKIDLWDVDNSQLLDRSLIGHNGGVVSVAFSADGKMLASGSDDMTVILWDVTAQKSIGAPLTGHTARVKRVIFSPDGKTLISLSDKEMIVWDVETRQSLGTLWKDHGWDIYSMALSPDGNTLASGDNNSSIILWDVKKLEASGEPLIKHTGAIYALAFSPDGKSLVSTSDDGTIIVWDANTRQTVGSPLETYAPNIAFNPDGRFLAVEDNEGKITLWNIATRQQLSLPFTGYYFADDSLVFSPDGDSLLSANGASVILWSLDPKSLIEQTCQRVGRNFTQAEWGQYFPGTAYHSTCSQWGEGK